MIKIIYVIFAIPIKDLKVRLDNLNLLLRKNGIWFEPLTQKGETDKQMADTLYYLYKKFVL